MFAKSSERLKIKHSFEQQKRAENVFALENSRGWLEPTSVQVNPSRSMERGVKKSIEITNQEDILGAVSDEDILKLAQLTAILPEVNKPKVRRHHRPVDFNELEQVKPADRIMGNIPISEPAQPQQELPDKKRHKWHYKSLVNPYKRKSKQYDPHLKGSDASSISSHHSVENTLLINTPSTSNILKTEDDSITRMQISSISNLERHDFFNKRRSLDSLQPLTRENEQVCEAENSIEIKEEPVEEEKKIFMFDYDSIPREIKSIIDEYEHKGNATRKKMIIRYREDSMDDEEEDEEDEEYEYVDRKDIIMGHTIEKVDNEPREIAVVTARASDTIEFKKLVQLSLDTENGPLLDLRISMFGDEGDIHHDDIQDLLNIVEKQLGSLEALETGSQKFLKENEEKLKRLDLSNIIFPGFEETSLADSSKDLFDTRQEEITAMLDMFRKDLQGLESSLNETDDLVQNIQSEVGDTRNRMEIYIKDIPETHYSSLKKLEVDIEAILSKRAKNPWLDTGYTLLSYLLTLFALVVWTVIYILKWGKKVVFFPNKLWVAYSDYSRSQ